MNQTAKLLSIVFAIATLSFGCHQQSIGTSLKQSPDDCVELRGAFDIGSGTTKLKVAQVNHCLWELDGEILYDEEREIPFAGTAVKTENGVMISEETLTSAIKSIETMSAAAEAAVGQELDFVGVGTAIFRDASNGDDAIALLGQKLGFPIYKLSQKDEAHLGFWAVVGRPDVDMDDVVVWDIGGESMQITLSNSERQGQLVEYLGQIASEDVKRIAIAEKARHNASPIDASTPNPIGLDAGLVTDHKILAEAQTIDSDFVALLNSKKRVIGIGGVLYHSVRGQVGSESKTIQIDQIAEAKTERINLSDRDLVFLAKPELKILAETTDSDTHTYREAVQYVDTDVGNLMLVHGFMNALSIKQVEVMKVNMADGTLINPRFWSQGQ